MELTYPQALELEQAKRFYVPGVETVFGEHAIRLNVTLEKDQLGTEKYKKLVVVVPPNMKFAQLRRKIEQMFEENYPREPLFSCGVIEDISSKPMKDHFLVGDHLRNDDKVFCYPKSFDHQELGKLPFVIDPKDLLSTIKNAHYSTVAELSRSQLEEYKNKVGVLEGILSLGFSHQKPVV